MGKGFFKNEMGFGQDFYTLKFYDPFFKKEDKAKFSHAKLKKKKELFLEPII